MKKVIKNNWWILASLIVFLVCYLFKIFFYNISIDTEALLADPTGQISAWYSINRWSLSLMKSLYANFFNVSIANIVATLFMFIFAIGFPLYLNKLTKSNNKFANFILSSIILTSPLLAEQLGFTLQSPEIALCFCLELLALWLITFAKKLNYIYIYIIATILLTISFACYQSFVLLWISLSAISCYLIFLEKKEIEIKTILQYVIPFLIGLVLFFVLSKVFLHINNIPESQYLNSSIAWKSLPKRVVVNNIIQSIKEVILGKGPLYNCLYIIISMIFIITNVKHYIKNKNLLLLLISLFIVSSPFLLTIILGNATLARAHFALIIVTGFLLFYVINRLSKKIIISLIAIFFLMVQSITTFTLFYSDYNRYKEDKEFATKIYSEVNISKPIVFIGKKVPDSKKILLTGEVLGHSFFEWDYWTELGVNRRVHGFMKASDLNYELPNKKMYKEAKKLSSNMKTGEIKEEEKYTIVKLSD